MRNKLLFYFASGTFVIIHKHDPIKFIFFQILVQIAVFNRPRRGFACHIKRKIAEKCEQGPRNPMIFPQIIIRDKRH